MTYTLPTAINFSSMDAPKNILTYLNGDILGGWLVWGTLLAFYILILSSYGITRRDWLGGAGVAGVTTFILATLAWLPPLNLVDSPTYMTVIALAIVGGIAMFLPKRDT